MLINVLFVCGAPFLVAWLVADDALLEWRFRESVEALHRINAQLDRERLDLVEREAIQRFVRETRA